MFNSILLIIVLINSRLSPTLPNTSTFSTWSVHEIFSSFLQAHISNAFKRVFKFLKDQVSAPYNNTIQISVLASFFLKFRFIFLVSYSLLLLNACLIMATLDFISTSHFSSSAIHEPRYLNLSTCSGFCPFTYILIFFSRFFDIIMTFVFFILSFMSYSFAVTHKALILSVSLVSYLPTFLDHLQIACPSTTCLQP